MRDALPQSLAPYFISVAVIDILPNATSRAAWEERISLEYGRSVVMRGAYDNARPSDNAAPFWGITYTAGSNGSLVRRACTLHVCCCCCA